MNDLEDTITVTIPNPQYDFSGMTFDDTINISSVTVNTMSSTLTYDSSYSMSGDTITFPDFDLSNINFTEFEGMLPPIEKVKEMCEEYPALEKAYENFKLIYKLVHDDWQSKLRGNDE